MRMLRVNRLSKQCVRCWDSEELEFKSESGATGVTTVFPDPPTLIFTYRTILIKR